MRGFGKTFALQREDLDRKDDTSSIPDKNQLPVIKGFLSWSSVVKDIEEIELFTRLRYDVPTFLYGPSLVLRSSLTLREDL
jgi:hypothetical protein